MSSLHIPPKLVLLPVLVIVAFNTVRLPLVVNSQVVQPEDHDDFIEPQLPPRQIPTLPQQWIAHHLQLARFTRPMTMNANAGKGNGNGRSKKDCGYPVLTRRLFGAVLKRSHPHLANSEEEVDEKIKEEDNSLERVKRNELSESHSGGCMAKRQWIDMGSDYYPRYVKSYHCTGSTCDRGFGEFGECKPKHYTTKVLKKNSPVDTTSVEDCDQTLPEALRFDWKLISVTVTTCCDCVSPASSIFGLN
ncbi:unnamed protein product [Orchesella dallaii]|uniref:Protein trunk n=1 Tax=Orchesella dallaii TaxID=48710 RepID=A0ABP1R7G3_9HEXA